MRDLTVSLIQTELAWEDVSANLIMFEERLSAIDKSTDLIILPEMFASGFTMNASKVAQSMDGAAVQWLRTRARRSEAVVAGSLVIEEKGRYFNRLVWAQPDGDLVTYDKRHLFRMSGEEKVYHAGDCLVTVELHGWKIRPFICYDLRFPLWTRNWSNGYDVALFVANWPARRSAHWQMLLRARAVENQSYVIGVNRVGVDGNDVVYSGDSMIIDPAGRDLFHQPQDVCEVTMTLSRNNLEKYRREFPAWMDADHEMLSPALRAQFECESKQQQ